MKPASTTLMLTTAVLGHCNDHNSTTNTSCTSTNTGTSPANASSPASVVLASHSFEPSPYGNSASAHIHAGPTNSASTNTGPAPTLSYTLTSKTTLLNTAAATEASSAIPASTPDGTASHPAPVGNRFHGVIQDELAGEIAEDENGDPLPIRFGLEGLVTLMANVPYATWLWPRLPLSLRPPVTAPVSEFRDTECTENTISEYEERRASKNLHWFCNRWQIDRKRLYASTAGETTLYMCAYGALSNCSLDMYKAVSAHLDQRCGAGATGWVHLRKMRIGRERTAERIVICPDLTWSPLMHYTMDQRERTVGGRPWKEWRVEYNMARAKEDGRVKGLEEQGNNEEPY
ncbi:hypothetical protein CCM_03808 [Cordyceps militaris CM01]|uniref:Uncharacterized protein n=1 Tax=Cordyceps militaris (strain CM01) TaxID=983644 RepID=G3JGS1_CORMM|nr:uncharacterized protein CCM_03808 [Cordyceps militaris CM01]EGX92435.1 hypothetical protein CCM_03808 [Cordyceps militaris CM01]